MATKEVHIQSIGGILQKERKKQGEIEMKKIVIVTGATSGIGRASAEQFAREGYRVILACRNEQLGRDVEEALNKQYGEKASELMQVDMESLASVRHFCEVYKSKYSQLDVLIHNAGCFNHGAKAYQLSPEGLELTFATNVFGPFLMSMLLKDVLAQGENPVIIGATSTNMQHFLDENRRIDFEDLEGTMGSGKVYNSYKMYGDSKEAISMILLRMAKVFKEEKIRTAAVMISGTKIAKKRIKEFPGHWRLLAHCQNFYSVSPEKMANNYYIICEDDKLKEMTGIMVSGKGELIKKQQEKMSDWKCLKEGLLTTKYYPAYTVNEDEVNKLWALCERITQLLDI